MKAYRMELYEASNEEQPAGRMIGAVILTAEIAGDDPIAVMRNIGRAMMHPKPLKAIVNVDDTEEKQG